MAFTRATNIADRMRDLRSALGLTQEEFGARFNRAKFQVSAWERGTQAPPVGMLERAASTNGWPLEIFEEGGPMPSTVVPKAPLGFSLVAESVRKPYGGESVDGGVAEAGEDAPTGPGWMWGAEYDEAEERFRDLLRNYDRTMRQMVARPEATELRKLRLAVIEMARKSAHSAGRPIPLWLQKIENEIVTGTFH